MNCKFQKKLPAAPHAVKNRILPFAFDFYLSLLASSFSVVNAHTAGQEMLPDSSHFRKVSLTTNLFEPIQLSISKRGEVYFAERHGAVKVWKPETEQTITIGQLNVFTGPEDGLLGLALDPGFETNHWLYAFHATVGILENRVSRFTVTNETLDLSSQKVLLHIPTLAKKPNHSGGGLGFDAAGNLYASTGDSHLPPTPTALLLWINGLGAKSTIRSAPLRTATIRAGKFFASIRRPMAPIRFHKATSSRREHQELCPRFTSWVAEIHFASASISRPVGFFGAMSDQTH